MTAYVVTRAVLWALMILVPVGAWYVLWGRTKLKTKPWMQWLYKSPFGEWSERTLFSKSESVLWGRILQVFGYGLSTILMFGDIDLTPLQLILPETLHWIPPVMPTLVSIAGHIQVKLRKDTSTPLDVIALPEATKQEPKVEEAVRKLDEAKAEVAVVIAEAKAEGIAR